ncbi:FSH1-domain-containing protein [Marasmius fiardii PR-910]|nr:FSH1-domain-containing protein [Marasmius fiardii PR-910]
MATKRVLVLHGYAQNANIFSKRLAALRKQCKGVELVFLDAPHVLKPVDLFGDTPDSLDSSSDPASTPRGWWKFEDSAKTVSVGLEETLSLIRDTLNASKFDGILGFSQGAGLATLIAALLENPHAYPPFLVDGQPPHPPLQYCVSVAGFKPNLSLSEAVLSPGFTTPTLHILGRTDVIVTEERSKSILDVTINSRVEEHDGGHFVPSKANWRKFLSDYLREGPEADLPSPGSMPSAPPSGTATPVAPDV